MAIKLQIGQPSSVVLADFEEADPKELLKNKDDYKRIVKLFGEFDEAEIEYYRQLHWHWDKCSEKEIKENLSTKTQRLFLARVDDELVGFATLWNSKMGKGTYIIAQICVSKDHRGKKIGRGLLNFIFEKTKGIQLFLTVTATNEAGKHLYEACGFKAMSQFMWREATK